MTAPGRGPERVRFAGVVLVAVLLAACTAKSPGAATPAPTSSEMPAVNDAATPEPAPAATPVLADITVGRPRAARVKVPSGHDPAIAAPLLVMLHGYSSSGQETEDYLQLAGAADTRGMLYVYPDGTKDEHGWRFWNASDACCGFGSDVDDVAYLTGLVEEIEAVANVDRRRIFFIGLSNGGFMSHAMACRHAELIAGIVSLAGAAPATGCTPSEAVAVLEVHGTADVLVRYEGGIVEPDSIGAPGHTVAPYPGAEGTAAIWLQRDGCDTMSESTTTLDLVAGVARSGGPNETTIESSGDCRPGGHVELWTVHGGGHIPDLSSGVAGLLLDFLLAHPKPQG